MNNTAPTDLYNFSIIHGRELCSEILIHHKDKVKGRKLQVSKDIRICTVIDHPLTGNPIQEVLINRKVHFLTIKTYHKWISKIETLVDYIKANYHKPFKYLLYIDGHDTMILNDILEPEEMLNFYKCKVLFSTEPYYRGTGYIPPTPLYMSPYESCRQDYITLNTQKYGSPMDFGINAGVFLGEKKYLLYILEEALSIMRDDVSQGFPYGCTDDQYVLRYLHNKHFDIVSGDVFNRFFFWGGSFSFSNTPGEELYRIGYSNRYLDTYLNIKTNGFNL